jgi:DNA polymerase/3'-5' exonuclease PolX
MERAKFPRSVATDVFLDLWNRFEPEPVAGRGLALCDRLCGVGGYRRGKQEMKDLELLFIPRVARRTDASDLFGLEHEVDVTAQLIEGMLVSGVLQKRLNVNGAISSWGEENKHAVHVASGLPVDLFAATPLNWPNRLVVTTGPKELNVRIAAAARARNFEWEVYDAGFVPLGKKWATAGERDRHAVRSERDVFAFVELPFLEPHERL